MGFHHTAKPKKVILQIENLPERARDVFHKFNVLCVLKEMRKETAYANLIQKTLSDPENVQLLNQRWVDWTVLQSEMKQAGFTINRTTFWLYRNKGMFDGMYKSDGVTTLFNLDAILGSFQKEVSQDVDLTKRTG